MRGRKTPAASLLVVLALIAAACGGDGTADTTDATEAPTGDTEASSDTTEAMTDTTEAMTDSTGTDSTGTDSEASGDPIVFGASLPLTGEFAIAGTLHQEGYQFCVDEINDRGGLLGRPVELLVEDNQSDSEVTVTQTERFITVENVDVLLGTFSSLLTFPASTVAEQNGYVYPVPSGGAYRIWARGFENIFYFQQLPAEFTGQSIVDLLAHYEEQGIVAERPATAAVVYADDFFAAAIANGFLGGQVEIPDSGEIVDLAPGYVEDLGMELVFEEQWPADFQDWINLANSIRQADADFLSISTASPEEAIDLIRALQTVDYQPELVYASQGAQSVFGETLGEAAAGVVVHSVWAPPANFEGVLAGEPYSNQDFIDGFTEAFGMAPDEDRAIPFAVCQGMEQAIRANDTTDNAVLSEWMHSRTEDDPVRTIMGDYVWDERGLPAARAFLVNQWQDGALEFVYPVGEFEGTTDLVYPKPGW